jgi:chromosome segregation ATPase
VLSAVPAEQHRSLGRPRVWGSEAERKRAYRARKAAELAGPSQLRDELRAARRALARATARAERAEAEAARQRARADGLGAQLLEAKARSRTLRAEAIDLHDALADAYDDRDHLRRVIDAAGLGAMVHR